MKFLVLLFLVGAASASFHDALDDAAEEIYHDFMVGMEQTPSLKEALGIEDAAFADDVENDIKAELGKRLREKLDQLLEKVKETIDHGKVVREDLQKKLQELKEKMKDLKVDMGDKARELLDKIKEKSKDFLKNLLEKLGLDTEKRSIAEEDLELALLDFNIRDLLGKLKKSITDNMDKEKLKDMVNKLFDKGSEFTKKIHDMLNEKGDGHKQKILDFIDRVLNKKGDDRKRSLKEYWEKVKNYFKDLGLDIKEKYFKFGEWVKETVKGGVDKSKDKMENIKSIAREFIDHTKGVSKDVAAEAIEFLRPYKDDLGSLWEQVKEAAKDVMNRKD